MTTTGLTVTVDGKPVPLDDCGWIQRRPCGCIVSALVAVVDGDGGWVLATAEQALQHLMPRKRSRDKADSEGLRMELITMDHYRQNIGANWECEQHAEGAQR
jgi:hypothetical protein